MVSRQQRPYISNDYRQNCDFPWQEQEMEQYKFSNSVQQIILHELGLLLLATAPCITADICSELPAPVTS